VVGRGRATASAARDFTIKVDVDGLSAGTTYYYRFHDPANEALVSDVGRTRTFAAGSVDRARFAVVSCSCFALGYFNAYADIASRKDLDAVLHLGDYIYEYGPETYDNPDLGRAHVPATEIVTLSDYRMRHAQYKSDPDLQEAHRQHPFICIWDDHEIANDAYAEGAQNHTDGSEGNFSERRAAALQAYGEWLPLREPYTEEPYGIYRRFRVGDLLDLIMLETRTRRSKQDRNAVRSDERSLLGETQAAWLEAELKASQSRGATWRVLGQQVMMGQLELFGQVLNADQWDGYQASRARLLGHIRDEGIDNVVVLTGDIHSSWAMDVVPDDATYDRRTGAGAVAVEFVSTSVTSPALEFLGGVAGAVALNSNPHMKWVDLERRGYLLLDVDHTRVQGDFYHSNTISMPIAAHRHAKSYRCDAGRAFLVEEPTPTSEKPGAPELA
jgi:alkaline phosphatase D